MRSLAVWIAALYVVATAAAQPPSATKKKAAPASAAKTVSRRPATAAKSPAAKGSASKAGAAKLGASKSAAKAHAKSKKAVVARRPPLQQQPSADRYREIQQALTDKGYFQGPVDGAWSAGSVDALKRFQKDQNLDADGKISALSLMALGLGPKRGATSAEAVQAGGEPVDPPPVAQPQP